MSDSTDAINIWGIHAGKASEADTLFLKKDRIALGWKEMGDLSKLAAGREAYKNLFAKKYRDAKLGAVQTNAGQLFRFCHDLKTGDFVVYPSKLDRQIHFGRVASEYIYDPEASETFPHARKVKWSHAIPRTQFTQGALYEIGSAMSFFQVKNYADEFLAISRGKPRQVPSVAQDDSIAAVAEDIEETTKDFILKRLAQELKGHPFAHFVAHLLNAMGYRTRVAAEGPDGGIDIVAHKDELGFEPPIIKVQVKSGEEKVGDPAVSALYGKVGGGEFGLFVTLGSFTPQATSFAKSKSNLRVIGGEELVDLIFQHYDQFDSRYKGLLPLRRVYVPEVIEGEG